MYEPETIGPQRFRIMGGAALPEFVFVESDRLDDCIGFAAENGLGIAIAPLNGFGLPDVSVLRRFPSVVRLALLDAEMIDISAINDLEQLRYLQISGKPSQSVVVQNFPRIEELRVRWWPGLNLKGSHECLKALSLRNYADKRGMAGVPSIPSLHRLNIVHLYMTTMSGMHDYPELTELKLTNFPKINSIAPLVAALERSSLGTLELDKCQSIRDHERLGSLTSLRRLGLNKCGEIESLGFLNDLPSLQSFSFVGTMIRDGDLSPCLRIQFVGFEDAPHYSHRAAAFGKVMQA